MLQMVDGEQIDDVVGSSDKLSYASNKLPRLSSDKCKNQDLIIIMGIYNTMEGFRLNYGDYEDCYPKDSTFCAYFNYMIKRVREELDNAHNEKCRIAFAAPHLFGSGPYMKRTAYEYAGLYDSLKKICNYQNIDYCDLNHYAGIDSTNWSVYSYGKCLDSIQMKLHPAPLSRECGLSTSKQAWSDENCSWYSPLDRKQNKVVEV